MGAHEEASPPRSATTLWRRSSGAVARTPTIRAGLEPIAAGCPSPTITPREFQPLVEVTREPTTKDAPIALLELNREFFPESVNTRVTLGDRLIAKGDPTAAVKRWEEAPHVCRWVTSTRGEC